MDFWQRKKARSVMLRCILLPLCEERSLLPLCVRVIQGSYCLL